ncbi:hypothetical protein HPB49_004316 [Dermacentor silvarum]|uniref:Uncharacterized protein n=1 Tax=Dermacentor silvarum TaxID=543639 RepID=A0ACB8D2Q0_DERSI|nr:hypothetical protein HPB49_004316 [Dermacentor silvarum]
MLHARACTIVQEVYGYAYSPWRSGLYRVLCALTLGLLPLVTSWKQEWYVQITCTPCQLSHATVLVVKDSHSRITISEVKTHPLINRRMSFSSSYQRRKRTFASEVCSGHPTDPHSRALMSTTKEHVDSLRNTGLTFLQRRQLSHIMDTTEKFRGIVFRGWTANLGPRRRIRRTSSGTSASPIVWSMSSLGVTLRDAQGRRTSRTLRQKVSVEDANSLECSRHFCGLDRGLKCVDLLERFQGYSKEEEEEQSVLYGRNSMELEVKSVAALLLEKVLHPFYVFQIVSIIVWLLDIYYFYAGCIIAFSVTSITLALHEARKPGKLYRSRSEFSPSAVYRLLDATEFQYSLPGTLDAATRTSCNAAEFHADTAA